MMPYRSAIQKTTGMTPNVLMLGRETKKPTVVLYEPPRIIKETPSNKWVLETPRMCRDCKRYIFSLRYKNLGPLQNLQAIGNVNI